MGTSIGRGNMDSASNTWARLRWGWLLAFVGAAFGATGGQILGDDQVRLIKSGERSFELASGDYRISYDLDKDKDGWILIQREGLNAAIGTKLAHGQHLDVTAAGAGEGDIYKWTHARKDSKIFRSLRISQTAEAIEIAIQSERQWANFDSRLIAYKRQPGLLHWTVNAQAKQDKAFSGDSTPDGHFVVTEPTSDWQRPTHRQVTRYAVQRGAHSGLVYFQDLAMKSLVFYFEDLTSLNDLYRLTRCDNPFNYPVPGNPGAVKIGEAAQWFQPAADKDGNTIPPRPFEPKVESFQKFGYERPGAFVVPKGSKLTLCDTYLYLRPADQVSGNVAICRQFVEMLADVYGHIRKPPEVPTDWRNEVVPQLVKDVLRSENTAVYKEKYKFPKAYVRYEHDDYQLWTLLNLLHPLELYVKKHPQHREARELRDRLDAALPLYWDENLKWFSNNLPPLNPDMFFTTVYIAIPSEMMADLALLGNENAKKLFLGARERFLLMGRACDYTFADVWLRDFSKQKVLYQFDATGVYVNLMMAYWQLSGGKDTEALEAAKAAAIKLEDRCLDLTWQVCMSARGVVGCQQLYQATGDTRYRELAYIPLANTLLQAWLWECDYGIGEKTTNFWAFSGCPAAPCSAEFEAHRTRLAFRMYLELAGAQIPTPVAEMLTDGWKRGMTQSRFSLPPLLVKDGAAGFMAAEGKSQTNCGEIRHDQMIPLEDVRPGWGTDLEWWQNNAKLGVVGQEIYGAGGPIWYALWQDELARP